ncbi:MAG: glycoside hydrolase domain-containing protein, partial [Verrucomicrobiota bacterium]
LDIPLRDDMAPLWHVLKTRIRGNPAGAAPGGEGEIWNSKKLRDGKWPGNFKPYLWLGGEERGLAWFADNEKGWVMDWKNQPPCQTLHRKGGVLTLRIHFVQTPIVLDEPRTIVFGLMASPAKPMPEDWRAIGRPDTKGIHFTMGHPFGLPAAFAGKYPINKDFSSLDAFYDVRKGADIDERDFANEWVERNLNYEGVTHKLRGMYRSLVATSVERGVGARDKRYTAYYDEVRGTTTFCEEHPYYRVAWDRQQKMLGQIQNFHERWGHRITTPQQRQWFFGSGAIVPSYRDFATYFGAQWLRRSVGLYFDNVFLETAENPAMTEAFYRDDGKIQPSCRFFAKREYFKRIWVLHQQLRLPETPQIMMMHMTNAHVIPWQSFNEVNLDLEWKFGARPFQAKFSPELLRTESTGLQTGAIPMAISDTTKDGAHATPQQIQIAERTRWGGFLVHEMRMEWSGQRWPEFMTSFGYGLDDCKVYNYWDDEPPMTVSDPRCKWLLARRNGKLLLVLCTWNPKKSEVTVTLDWDKLGVQPARVFDVENPDVTELGQELELDFDDMESNNAGMGMSDPAMDKKLANPNAWQGPVKLNRGRGTVQIPLDGYGVRVLQLEE